MHLAGTSRSNPRAGPAARTRGSVEQLRPSAPATAARGRADAAVPVDQRPVAVERRPPFQGLAGELPEDQAGVVAAEAEVVRQRDIDVDLPRLVRHVVEVALRVGSLVVDRRRNGIPLAGEDRQDRLDRAGGAEAVSGRAFGGGDGGAPRLVLAERNLDHARLAGVSTGVDVACALM